MRKGKKTTARDFKVKAPKILVRRPRAPEDPEFVKRKFHEKDLNCWLGYVDISDISGWVENERIRLWAEEFKHSNHGRAPNTDDIFEMMKSDTKMELEFLANRIKANGVQVPIVLTADGVLLDGNRRYYACKLLREIDGPVAITLVPAYVLLPNASPEDIENVLIETNFIDDGKKEWSHYIKAKKVYDKLGDFPLGTDPNVKEAKTAAAFGIEPSEVRRTRKMMDLLTEYTDHRGKKHEIEQWRAEQEAEEWFQYFDELSKPRVKKVLDDDIDFKERVFDTLAAGRFQNWPQVRRLPDISENRDARKEFFEDDGESVRRAIKVVEMDAPGADPRSLERKLASIIGELKGAKATDLKDFNFGLLDRLRELVNELIPLAEEARRNAEKRSAQSAPKDEDARTSS